MPVIGFARGLGAAHLELSRRCRACGIGAGCRQGGEGGAWHGPGQPDLVALMAGAGARRDVERIVSTLPLARHVFNLGHGIRPQTEPRAVERLVGAVRRADGGG